MIRTLLLALAWVFLFGGTAFAQTQDSRAIAGCSAAAQSYVALDDCRGRISAPCLQADGGETTAVSVRCFERERAAWDIELNTVYRRMQANATSSQADLLRAAQRAWIPWRDAKCAMAASVYEGGSLARVILASCLAEETAKRTVELIAFERGPEFE